MGLRAKILLLVIGLLVFFGAAVLGFVKTEFTSDLVEALQKRGLSICKHIASISSGDLISEDRLALKMTAYNLQELESDIAYIFFVDGDSGQVLAHTFGETFPVELLGVNDIPEGHPSSIRRLISEKGPVYDVAVPILKGSNSVVRLGMSGSTVEQAVDAITGEVVVITLSALFLATLVAIPLTRAIVQPVRHLTEAIRSVADGKLDQSVAVHSGDEIEQLGASFNHMTRRLAAAHRQLVEEVGRRQDAEKKLADQLRFVETLLEHIPLPVYFKDTSGLLIGCNGAFADCWQVAKASAIGRPTSAIFPAALAESDSEQDKRLWAASGCLSHEERVIGKGGGERHFLFIKSTFTGEGGGVAGLVGVLLDRTRERELARLRNEFVSTVAHEFQTPLAVVFGFAELLLSEESISDADRRDYASHIADKAQSLSTLVDELLDVSRIEEGAGFELNKTPVCVADIVGQVICGFRASGEHRFELSFPADSPPVLADRERLVQVVENLVSNAGKYSPRGRTIRITGGHAPEGYRLAVEDEGVGMSPDQVAQIFNRFYRADTSDTAPRGTGLGMTIVKSIIDSHGGWIDVESHPDQGTRVSCVFPLEDRTGPAAEVAQGVRCSGEG